jgi:hypothetical protein
MEAFRIFENDAAKYLSEVGTEEGKIVMIL